MTLYFQFTVPHRVQSPLAVGAVLCCRGIPALARKIGDTTPGTIGYDLGGLISSVGGR